MAATAYTTTFIAGTALSLRRGYRAEPLGLRTGLSPVADLVAGFGSALSAPWSMIALLWQADRASRQPAKKGRKARVRLATLGALFLSGAVAEPISHRLFARKLPIPDAVVTALNIALPVVILGGALASLLAPDEAHLY